MQLLATKKPKSPFTLRWYQDECVNAVYQLLDDEPASCPLAVIPTGGGKALTLADIAARWIDERGSRVIQTIHTKELVAQNWETFRRHAPHRSAGIFSAGLGRKDVHGECTFSSVQSIYRHAERFRNVGLWLIDEAHLVPHAGDGQYLQMLEGLRTLNPDLRVVGVTATPYRLNSGSLVEPWRDNEPLFSDIAYELSILDLVEEGYLCELVASPTRLRMDTKGIRKVAGEFSEKQLNDKFNTDDVNAKIVKETITKAADRHAWVVFAISIDHAERLAELFRDGGIDTEVVHGQMGKRERDSVINRFKAGRLRCVVNCQVLTTGFDYPAVDCIVMARPTGSPGLLTQIAGRGMRPVYAPGMPLDTPEQRLAAIDAGSKGDCLVLDYASNIARHGRLDSIKGVFRSRRKKPDDLPEGHKACKECGEAIPFGTMVCTLCGAEQPAGGGQTADEREQGLFDRQTADRIQASRKDLLWCPVLRDANGGLRITFRPWHKDGKPPTLRLDYMVDIPGEGPQWVGEWLSYSADVDSFLYKRAAREWRHRCGTRPPASTEEAIARIAEMRPPVSLRLYKDGRFWSINGARLK